MNIEQESLNIIAEHLPECPAQIIADGKCHRFGAKNTYWYIIHTDGIANITVGDWATSFKVNVKLSNQEPGIERKSIDNSAAIKRAEERATAARAAAHKAQYIWNIAKKTKPVDHPYIIRKRIVPMQVGLDRYNNIVIPVYNVNRELVTVQMISDDGVKRFLTGSDFVGCFGAVGMLSGSSIYIAEGYATACTIASKYDTLCFFTLTAGNMLQAARNIKALYAGSGRQIVIMADNDKSGVGQAAGREAAKAIGAELSICPTEGMDFNDYFNS